MMSWFYLEESRRFGGIFLYITAVCSSGETSSMLSRFGNRPPLPIRKKFWKEFDIEGRDHCSEMEPIGAPRRQDMWVYFSSRIRSFDLRKFVSIRPSRKNISYKRYHTKANFTIFHRSNLGLHYPFFSSLALRPKISINYEAWYSP